MSKHNRAKLEKAERNKLHALKFKKEREKSNEKKVRYPHIQANPDVEWVNWCRMKGHPSTCNCVYPSYEEVLEASRPHRR